MPEQAAGDGDGVLPQEHLRAERSRDTDAVPAPAGGSEGADASSGSASSRR